MFILQFEQQSPLHFAFALKEEMMSTILKADDLNRNEKLAACVRRYRQGETKHHGSTLTQ